MDFVKDFIRISFFRLFIPIIVGVTFSTILFLFFYIFLGNEYKDLFHSFSHLFSKIYKLSTFIGNVLVFSIFFVIGEFLSSLGEIIIGFFFECHIPFYRKSILEKLSPYLERRMRLTYKDFINTFQQENTIVEISEVHYTISRLFAGLALSFFVLMLLSLSLVSLLLSLLVSLLLLAICVFTHRDSLFRLSIDIDIILLFTSLALLFTLFTDNKLTTNQTMILASLSFFFAFLTLSSIRISIFYRAHANKLIYYFK